MKQPYIRRVFLFYLTMSKQMIHIEKSKYTALLRRVLGMRVSENGTYSELEAVLESIQSSARYAKNSSGSKEDVEGYMENISFAMELYNLRKKELWPTEIIENIPSTEEYPA